MLEAESLLKFSQMINAAKTFQQNQPMKAMRFF
jgi:hypothetical protein